MDEASEEEEEEEEKGEKSKTASEKADEKEKVGVQCTKITCVNTFSHARPATHEDSVPLVSALTRSSHTRLMTSRSCTKEM